MVKQFLSTTQVRASHSYKSEKLSIGKIIIIIIKQIGLGNNIFSQKFDDFVHFS